MEMGKRETRKSTVPASSGRSDERTARALKSAARWLQRRGKSRAGRDTKHAYTEAAAAISKLSKKIH